MNRLYVMVSMGLVLVGLAAHSSQAQEVSLSPENWPDGEVGRMLDLMKQMPTPNPLVQGSHGAISGTFSAPAMRAGFEALEQGGSAVDAVLTTANSQIALSGGAWVSYTGILSMVYYDASTGDLYNLNAGYNTVLGEDDPLTIPGNPALFDDPYGGTPSGRSALVPGYIAGVEAAHNRFGKLPFRCLFEPAIFFAEEGFEITPYFASFMESRSDVLSRLPETRAIFCDEDGIPLKAGQVLKQELLAETLRQVSENGADYIYRGPWTTKFVEAIQSEGGNITAEDMDRYHVLWSSPARGSYREYEVASHGAPAFGGTNTVEALKLYELSELKDNGHYSEDPESLFWLAQFHRAASMEFLPDETIDLISNTIDADLSLESRLQPETSRKILDGMRSGRFLLSQRPTTVSDEQSIPKHSDAVVAVDQWGNVCAIVHSINTIMWGKTGIFVDGISVNDSASFQQSQIAKLEPGSRLPDPTNPTIVLNGDGKPILVCSAMGSGLHQKTNQCLINVLDFGMNPKEADEAPYLMTPTYQGLAVTERVIQGRIDADVLDRARSMGLLIEELEANTRFAQGLWIGITIDPDSGQLETASPAVTNGASFAR